jgi:hypothetical protein
MRKYPPFKPSGLTPGAQYRVARSFTAGAVTFELNEIVTFQGEGFIPEEQYDVWRFTLPGEMRLKEIVGTGEFANPDGWRECFEKVAAAEPNPAVSMQTMLARTTEAQGVAERTVLVA